MSNAKLLMLLLNYIRKYFIAPYFFMKIYGHDILIMQSLFWARLNFIFTSLNLISKIYNIIMLFTFRHNPFAPFNHNVVCIGVSIANSFI